MNIRRFVEMASIKSAFLAVALVFAQPVPAQVASGKQQRAEDIPSTSQALAGRLFFSREQRERLDRARAGGGMVVAADVIDPPASRINGFVKRSDGETAVWVDGIAQYKVSGENAAQLRPQDVGGASNEIRILASSLRTQGTKGGLLPKTKAKIPHKKMPASVSRDGAIPR